MLPTFFWSFTSGFTESHRALNDPNPIVDAEKHLVVSSSRVVVRPSLGLLVSKRPLATSSKARSPVRSVLAPSSEARSP